MSAFSAEDHGMKSAEPNCTAASDAARMTRASSFEDGGVSLSYSETSIAISIDDEPTHCPPPAQDKEEEPPAPPVAEPVLTPIVEEEHLFKCDRYGFLQDDKRWKALDENLKSRKKNVKKERDRTTKWLKMLKNWDKYLYQKPEKLKNRIRKGIPDAMRGAVWPILIGAQGWREKYPEAMDPARMATVSYGVRDDITKDLNRTYPRHELFSKTGIGQESLERVLVLYAAHDPTTNYCQGMGFIAGMFLMYMDEESAFYCMVGALENPEHPLRTYFLPGFAEVRRAMYVYSELGRQRLPKLFAHLEQENLHESMYSIEWFMTIYTRSFRFDLVTRIWDVMLHEGKKIVFRVALALMKSVEKQLLALPFEGMMALLRELPVTADTDVVMETMWKIPLKLSDVTEIEERYVANGS